MSEYNNVITTNIYKSLYILLADRIEHALQLMESGNCTEAMEVLAKAQGQAEDMYTHGMELAKMMTNCEFEL